MVPDALQAFIESLRGEPLLPLLLPVVYVVWGALFLPVWLLILQTGLLIDPPLSSVVALGGATLSALAFYGVGRLASGPIRRRFGAHKTMKAIEGAGIEHVIALRVLPVLPFTLVNVAAGALGVRFTTYAGGTVAGMAPGVIAVTFLGDRARAVFVHPTPSSVALLVGAAAAFLAVATVMRRVARRLRSAP